MLIRKSLILAVFILAASPIISSAGVITFSGFPDLTVLTTQDFGDGVTFDGTTILTCCNSLGTGSLNPTFPPVGGIVAGENVAYNPSGPLSLLFTNPSDFFSAYFTYNSGLTVTAYDSSNAVLGSVNGACGASGSGANYVGSGCGAPNELLSLNFAGEISKVVITGGSGNNFTIDNVSFSGAVDAGAVPEPGTSSLMLLGGLGGLVVFARKRLASGNVAGL